MPLLVCTSAPLVIGSINYQCSIGDRFDPGSGPVKCEPVDLVTEDDESLCQQIKSLPDGVELL